LVTILCAYAELVGFFVCSTNVDGHVKIFASYFYCLGLLDCSDSESEEGVLERVRGAVAHLFVNAEDSSDNESSSEEVETDSVSSDAQRSPATERAVFLNKHGNILSTFFSLQPKPPGVSTFLSLTCSWFFSRFDRFWT